MKYIMLFIVLFVTSTVQAAPRISKSVATTGALVGGSLGYAIGSSQCDSSNGNTTSFTVSDVRHDILVCKLNKQHLCVDYEGNKKPEVYAKYKGYQYIHRKHVVFDSGKVYSVMEVSK